MPQAVFLYANKAAREIAESKDGIAIEAGGISVGSAKQHPIFREAVGSIALCRDDSVRRMEVPRPSRKQPYRVMLMPVQASGMESAGRLSSGRYDPHRGQRFSAGPGSGGASTALFAYFRPEARVTGQLALGKSIAEIAAEANISVETVRTHIKRALSKTGTARQGELISPLILRSTPFLQL